MQKAAVPVFLAGLLCTILLLSCLSTEVSEEPVDQTEVEKKEQTETIQQLILTGKYDDAKAMFESQANINMADENGNTPLHAAAQVNNADLITFLIYKGAETELKNAQGDTPLHVAIKYDSVDAARVLAAVNSDIFSRDTNGKTALELGIAKGKQFYDAMITTATGEKQDAQGLSIIHYFVRMNDRNAILYSISKQIPISRQDNSGMTPLGIAYRQNTLKSIEIAVDLLEAGAVPQGGNYEYFETAIMKRNPSMRFEEGQTPLHIATIQGQTGIVHYLLTQNASCSAQNTAGSTPLHEAVRYGRTDIVQILLQNGANPNAKDSLGKTPLLLLVPKETQSVIYQLLIKYHADVNVKDMYGDAPLHIATIAGSDIDALELLINAGADINERNKEGVTPLALAVDYQRKDLVQFFTTHNGDIHAEDLEGKTPLTRALKANKELLSVLVNTDNVISRDSFGNTPLHIAVTTDIPSTGTDGSLNPDRKYSLAAQSIKYLLSLGADINARNRSGDTPLSLAVQKNKRQAGEVLLAAGADIFVTNTDNYSPLRLALSAGGERQEWLLTSEVINSTDGSGNTPMHYAAEWKLNNAITALVEKGSSVNAQNANGQTPLFSAVHADSPDGIALLIRNGAQKNARDYLGNTPLHTSIRWDTFNAARTLIASGVDIDPQNLAGKTPLAEAAYSGKMQMITLLLNNGANINASDATGKTVLIDAIQSGKPETVRTLLERGASVQVQEMYGRNAYHFAAESGDIEMITIIREAGGNAMARDKNGRTPLTLVLNSTDDIIQAVLGSNKDISDSDGNTPIHIAVTQKVPPEKLRLLVSMGYPINRRNSNGLTALAEAANLGQADLLRVLLENGANPYITDNKGECAVSFALRNGNKLLLEDIVKYAGTKRDISGEGILHYAARIADQATVNTLLSMGLDKTIKSISGERPYDVAIRWKRTDIAELLK